MIFGVDSANIQRRHPKSLTLMYSKDGWNEMTGPVEEGWWEMFCGKKLVCPKDTPPKRSSKLKLTLGF